MKQKKKELDLIKVIHNHMFEMKISTISTILFSIPFIPNTNKPVSIANQLALAIRIYIYIYICES